MCVCLYRVVGCVGQHAVSAQRRGSQRGRHAFGPQPARQTRQPVLHQPSVSGGEGGVMLTFRYPSRYSDIVPFWV
jgi:hypothetical protein